MSAASKFETRVLMDRLALGGDGEDEWGGFAHGGFEIQGPDFYFRTRVFPGHLEHADAAAAVVDGAPDNGRMLEFRGRIAIGVPVAQVFAVNERYGRGPA